MPIVEIQLVETKQSSQYDTHINLCVVCEACKQSHVRGLSQKVVDFLSNKKTIRSIATKF